MTTWVLIVFVSYWQGVGLTHIPDIPTQAACKQMGTQIVEEWERGMDKVEYLCIEKPAPHYGQ